MEFVIIFALIVSIGAVIFALQNPVLVTLKFFSLTFEQPLALFLLIALALGALIIAILSIPGWLGRRKLISRHRKEVAELEENLSKYRSNLIDAQNSNKDLRQKILEIEGAKEALEKAQRKTIEEMNDLQAALDKADLSSQEAEQAKKEAIEAREQMNLAMKELAIRLDSAQSSAETYKGMLDHMNSIEEAIRQAAEARRQELPAGSAEAVPEMSADEEEGAEPEVAAEIEAEVETEPAEAEPAEEEAETEAASEEETPAEEEVEAPARKTGFFHW